MTEQRMEHVGAIDQAATKPKPWAAVSGWLGRLKPNRQSDDAASEIDLPVRTDVPVSVQAQSMGMRALDMHLLWVALALACWGWVMVYSTTIAMPEQARFSKLAHTYFLYRHSIYLVLALAVGYVAFRIPTKRWDQMAIPFFMVSVLLLVSLLVMMLLGKQGTKGAHRWISLGFVSFQPSEMAKLGILLYASNYMVRKLDVVKQSFWRAVWPMATAVGVVGMLLLSGTDMGSFMVIAVIVMGILFLAGINARMFFLILAVLIAVFLLVIFLGPEFRQNRVFAYLDPWNKEFAQKESYQLTHALIAVGRGELFGVGLGASVEKLHWLPEAHTDFLMAVIGEEFGFIGVVVLIGLLFWMIKRMVHIGRQSIALGQLFSGLVAQGVAVWFAFQALVHIGVNIGALPTKGLTLPLMSYGGSALLFNAMALGLVLRVDLENRHIMRAGGGSR